jgi:hypothetical protein
MSSRTSQDRPPQSGVDSQPPPLPIPADPVGTIRASLHDHKLKKWGLLLYRCDYSSDEAWTSLLATVHAEMQLGLEVLKAPDLLSSLDMTVQEDCATLDGASVNTVRDVFKAWVEGDEAKEELSEAPYPGPFWYARYTYCVHIDAAAVESVARAAVEHAKRQEAVGQRAEAAGRPVPQLRSRDLGRIGFVNLVRLRPRDVVDDTGPKVDPEDEEHDEDEGDENAVRIPLVSLDPEMYAQLFRPAAFDVLRRHRRKGDGVSLVG